MTKLSHFPYFFEAILFYSFKFYKILLNFNLSALVVSYGYFVFILSFESQNITHFLNLRCGAICPGHRCKALYQGHRRGTCAKVNSGTD